MRSQQHSYTQIQLNVHFISFVCPTSPPPSLEALGSRTLAVERHPWPEKPIRLGGYGNADEKGGHGGSSNEPAVRQRRSEQAKGTFKEAGPVTRRRHAGGTCSSQVYNWDNTSQVIDESVTKR